MRITSAAILLLALAAAACKGPTDPGDNKVDSFNGTVEPGKSSVHSFDIANTGELHITLDALSSASPVGIGYGQAAGTDCALNPYLTRNVTSSSVGKEVLADQIYAKGTYCVTLFDIGGLTASVTYAIRVSHP